MHSHTQPKAANRLSQLTTAVMNDFPPARLIDGDCKSGGITRAVMEELSPPTSVTAPTMIGFETRSG